MNFLANERGERRTNRVRNISIQIRMSRKFTRVRRTSVASNEIKSLRSKKRSIIIIICGTKPANKKNWRGIDLIQPRPCYWIVIIHTAHICTDVILRLKNKFQFIYLL